MKKITPVILALGSFLLGLLFLVLPAWAENWVEVSHSGRAKTFYDTDNAIVDTATGLVIVRTAIMPEGKDEYWYVEVAFNCFRDTYYVISTLEDGTWLYFRDIGEEYSSTDRSSYGWTISRWACDNYNSHPSVSAQFPERFNFPQ